jgi:cupin fold WbuC family metalloprotein
MIRKEIRSATETTSGVFHANKWGQQLEENLIELLIEKASLNPKRKARLCLHPTPNEIMQVTYIAFCRPYSDQIHKHPHRPEIVIPIYGVALHSIYDHDGMILRSQTLDGENPVASITEMNSLHNIEVLSDNFVMIEIGTGPFMPTSTIYID